MIWDFIRDFIVEHITGGTNSSGFNFDCGIGKFGFTDSEGQFVDQSFLNGNGLMVPVNGFTSDDFFSSVTHTYISFSDWLATTLTVVCMCLIVAFAIWLIIWVFKAVAHAFLLRR